MASTRLAMPDVGVLAVVVVEAVAAGVLVAVVEVVWLLPPQPASVRAAITPNKTRLNLTPTTLLRALSVVNDDR